MKKLFVFFIPLLFAFNASAQLESYLRITKDAIEPDVNIFVTKAINSEWSLTGFALMEKGFGEGLIGLAYAPAEWIEVGLSGGIEIIQTKIRLGTSLILKSGDIKLVALYENGPGKDNYWYNVTLWQKVSDKFSFGARAWRFHGIGAIAKLNLAKLDTDFWFMPAYDYEFMQPKFILGASVNL